MSINYTNYSNPKSFNPIKDEDEIIITTETEIEQVIEPESSQDEIKMGYVDCAQLNLREYADKDSNPPIAVLTKDEEVMIISEDDPDWYEVCTSRGQEGFCMKQYIRVES